MLSDRFTKEKLKGFMKHFGKMLRFTKSLKFRLTLTYSLILFLFTGSFVLGINIYLNNYFKQEPPRFSAPPPGNQFNNVQENPYFEFGTEEKKKIREIRLNDLERIQDISVIMLAPLSLISFAIGYYLSDRFLYPLKLLQKKIDNLDDKDLGSQVEIFEDDEVGDLARSFNNMSTKLKRSFDAQTQFVQDASHELKTPLTIIQTSLDFLATNAAISKNERQELLDNALDGVKRMRKLTDRLLDLTLPDKLKTEETDLNKLINEQYSVLKSYAKEEKVELKVDMPKRAIVRNADEVLLGRAIFNLIENAIKYSKDVSNPKVIVSLKELKELGPNQKAKTEGKESNSKVPQVEIKVSDNGKGIPKKYQSKVFDRFYRIDKSRSREMGKDSGGFGLGLAITKKIVEEHGGTIELESASSDKPGEHTNMGTTFRIVL